MYVLLGSLRNEATIFWTFCLASSSSVPWAPSAWAFETAVLTALIMRVEPLVDLLEVRADLFLGLIVLGGLRADLRPHLVILGDGQARGLVFLVEFFAGRLQPGFGLRNRPSTGNTT